MSEKVLVAMSGGVDSSVAAYLIREAGYEATGVTMRLYDNETIGISSAKTCCSLDSINDAVSVANRLGIYYLVYDFREEFKKEVIQRFIDSYEQGITPNPCVECNRYLKFDHLYTAGKEIDQDYIATGHYAIIEQDRGTGRYLLKKSADLSKDQSYVLYSLTQDQLSRTLFPLGGLHKTETRRIAEEQGFINAEKRDSQDICFVPDGDYGAFLQRYTGKTYPEGDFLDLQGQVVGHHRGAACYTLGQRKGLGLAMGAPVYVCAKDMQRNTVTAGPSEALFSPALRAGDWNWYPFPALTAPMRVTAKTRHSQFEQAATVFPEENGFARVEFDQPQRAVTPGQAVVLYDGDIVVGGGTITMALPQL